MVTVFAHIKDVENPFYKEIDDVLLDIKNGSNKDFVLTIRKERNKKKRDELKRSLRSICFSGIFSYRSARNCTEHSGYACLDWDDIDEPEVLRDSLQDNEYIYSAFVSPSGNGVKALIKIPPSIKDHKKYYEAICETFDTKLDTSTKDISRVCYESYDPNLWINEDSKVWELKKDYTEVTQRNKYPKHFQIHDTNKKVDVIMKWFNKKFTLNAGERNNNLFKLACGLNRAGMPKDECLVTFNSFYSAGLKEAEIKSIVDSAYKNTHEFDTLTLIDDNKIVEAERLLKKGINKAKREYKREGLSNDEIDDIIDFDFEEDFLIFWDVDKNGKIALNDYKFKLFLENRGYYKVQLNEKEFTFVKVYNNVISEINETHIKDFILNYVIEIDIDVYNYFAKATTKFTEGYLNQLATRELTMLRDNPDESYLFFKNIIAKVTKDKVEYIKYIDCGGLVWKKNIINREFKMSKGKSDFEVFVNNISGDDKERKKTLECSIGYLLNTYKKQNEGVSIVLYDETLNDNPSGRTGKTVLSKALGELRKITTLNGKEFNNKGQFPYQTVNLDDNILVFDDLTRNFKFEELFSIITGDLTLNKKNLQPIVIPYERSPKILFTSNYVLSGTGDSHEARKIEIELYRHYSKDHQPVDEFKKMFFTDWNEQEWNDFYSYMIRNIQLYFENGLIKPELATARTRKLISNTNEDFYDFCENEFLWSSDKLYTTKEVYQSFNDGSREVPKNMNNRWFGRWLSSYFEFMGWKREDVNNGGVRKFKIIGCGQKEDKFIY